MNYSDLLAYLNNPGEYRLRFVYEYDEFNLRYSHPPQLVTMDRPDRPDPVRDRLRLPRMRSSFGSVPAVVEEEEDVWGEDAWEEEDEVLEAVLESEGSPELRISDHQSYGTVLAEADEWLTEAYVSALGIGDPCPKRGACRYCHGSGDAAIHCSYEEADPCEYCDGEGFVCTPGCIYCQGMLRIQLDLSAEPSAEPSFLDYILPGIRNTHPPGIIAQDLVSVQPLSRSTARMFFVNYEP